MRKWLLAVAVATVGSTASTAPHTESPAYVTIHVPVGATLLVNGTRTNQMTAVRQFVSPPLPAGTFYYTFTASFTWHGEPVIKQKQVEINAGDRVSLDMMTGEDISPPPPKVNAPVGTGIWSPPTKPAAAPKPSVVTPPEDEPKAEEPPKTPVEPKKTVEPEKKPMAPPPRPVEEPKKLADPMLPDEPKTNPFRKANPKADE